MQVTQATASKFNNNHVFNRLGLNGYVLNIAEVSENGRNVVHFDLAFPQEGADDGILPCRAESPQIINFSRRVHEGYPVEVGGMLCQDADGFYVQAYYVQFVKKENIFKGGLDAAKTAESNAGR
jgi:hypothetical protein